MNHAHSNEADPSLSLRGVFYRLFLREKDPPYLFLILGAITLIGFALRMLDIHKSIAYDEAYTFIHFASRPFRHILADYSAPNNHIFHTILVGIAYRLLGGQAWVLRLPAFTAGVLMIPAMYLTARRFFSAAQALAAAGLVAVIPVFIDYSVNGRGYTMLMLFALLLANFAGILVARPSRPALVAYTITSALGFYTIPIFLYPWAGISLWVFVTYLFAREARSEKVRRLGVFLGTCMLAGLLTMILYLPVIIFGSGLASIIGNEIVQPMSWPAFLENLDPRMTNTWAKWMIGIGPVVEYLFLGGFLLSLIFYRKVSNQKLPLQLFLALAVAILLVLQRVTPTPRIWLYLEAFYLMFAAAGLTWLADPLIRRMAGPRLGERILAFAILLVFIGAFAGILIERQQNPAYSDRDRLPEEYAADYLAEHLKPEDTIVATAPVDIQTAYYLSLRGIPFDRFYKRDHPVEIQNGLVLLRKNSSLKTPESVLDFLNLTQALDLNAAELVFEYANVQIYAIPAK
ncbi:MAG: glycosyltransferase family 39 protein [Anaerolineales bacterium]